MADERNLVASFIRSREAFDRVAGHLTDADLTEQAKVIVEHVGAYYGRDAGASHVDPALLTGAICRTLPNPKHQAMFTELVSDLSALEVSPANVVTDFIAVRRQAVGSRLASLLAAGKPVEDVRPTLQEYETWARAETVEEKALDLRQGQSVTSLVAARTRDGGLIKCLPKALNERLDGGLLRGHHMLVFARPEVGKTMFLVNAIAGFVQQRLNVLYVGNEDPLDDVIIRLVGRLSNMTRHEIIDDPDKADRLAREEGYDRVVLAGMSPGTPAEIDKLAEEYKPDVIVVDQLRNLGVGKEDNFTRKLEIAAQQMRAIGQRRKAVVITVTQAGDSASGKSILDMGDVDSSNTGIPAQADVMVGIGMSDEDEANGRRVISLPKNKPGGNHGTFPVLVDPTKSRIRSE